MTFRLLHVRSIEFPATQASRSSDGRAVRSSVTHHHRAMPRMFHVSHASQISALHAIPTWPTCHWISPLFTSGLWRSHMQSSSPPMTTSSTPNSRSRLRPSQLLNYSSTLPILWRGKPVLDLFEASTRPNFHGTFHAFSSVRHNQLSLSKRGHPASKDHAAMPTAEAEKLAPQSVPCTPAKPAV